MIRRELYRDILCKHCKTRIVLTKNWGAISDGKFICNDKKCLAKELKEEENAKKVKL